HVLVHGDEALEPRRVLLLLLLRAAAGLLLQTLELVDAAVEPPFRRLEQVLADLELARPRVELLAPLAQPLEDRALGRRARAVLVELGDGAGPGLGVGPWGGRGRRRGGGGGAAAWRGVSPRRAWSPPSSRSPARPRPASCRPACWHRSSRSHRGS